MLMLDIKASLVPWYRPLWLSCVSAASLTWGLELSTTMMLASPWGNAGAGRAVGSGWTQVRTPERSSLALFDQLCEGLEVVVEVHADAPLEDGA